MIQIDKIKTKFPHLSEHFFEKYQETLSRKDHGAHAEKYRKVFSERPEIITSLVTLDQDYIQIGEEKEISKHDQDAIKKQLTALRFWRKGPFDVFGIHIDAEWQANLKWDRIKGYEDSLFKNKRVLDVGASSGYYMMRMLAHNPEFILGIDPTFLYFKQFAYLQSFLKKEKQSVMDYLVLGIEDMADFNTSFDTVVCMGILYHRPCSLTAIKRLKALLKEGGTLLLESIVIDAEKGLSLGKNNRYAGMRNVYEIPTEKELLSWVKEAGFKRIKTLDVSKTNTSEQRSTPWTTEVSLKDFLHPSDHSKTVEGHPAPMRWMGICE